MSKEDPKPKRGRRSKAEAVKAIEGASGAKAFQIALEQTKVRPISA